MIRREQALDALAEMTTSPPGPLTAVGRHKRLAAMLVIGIVSLTVLVVLFYPRQYHSTAKLLLRIGRENVTLDPTATTTGETQAVMRTRESEVLTAMEMMASREIVAGVIEEIGADTILSGALPGGEKSADNVLSQTLGALKGAVRSIDPIDDRERAIVSLEGDLTVSAPSEAGVVTIDYCTDTPELAQLVVKTWVKLFQEHYITATRTHGAFEFFVEQEDLITKELNRLRASRMEAKNQYGLVTVEGQQQMIEGQIQKVRLDRLSTEAKLAEVETRIDSLDSLANELANTMVTQNVTGKANESHVQMRSRLYDLEVEEKRASAFLTARHPRLQALRKQLETAAKVVDSQEENRTEVTEGINPTRQLLDENLALAKADRRALQTKVESIDSQLERLRAKLEEVNSHERYVSDIDRRVEILEERYRVHSHRFEEARLDRALEEQRVSSVNVVQAATLERLPVTPNKKLCTAFGLLAALSASVGIPWWIESGRSSEMAQLNLAALTHTPETPEGEVGHPHRRAVVEQTRPTAE